MTTTHEPETLDPQRIEEFAARMFGTFSAGVLTLMIDLAHRTGLFAALADGPATSEELAHRGGLVERYARECLGALVTGGVVDYEPATRRYTMPAEHAACLAGEGSLNVAPMSAFTTLLAHHVAEVARVSKEGGGVPYERYQPDFTAIMDDASRGGFDGQLIDGLLPLVDGLSDRLRAGIAVADIGCGTGHAINLMAAAYPASTFVGYDLLEESLRRGGDEAARLGLTNVRFESCDVAALPPDVRFDAVLAFDAIHDQVDPAAVLRAIRRVLPDGGVFVMVDINASSRLENNMDHPIGPFLYGVSTLHCMTVSLAGGGAGLGAMWGRELALTMLDDAGFGPVTVHDVPDDPFNLLYVAYAR